MERGWMDHPLFRGEPFTKAQAWEWLIMEANFKDTKWLKRGQLSHSIRHLSSVWQWHRARTERFLTRLKTETMIETETRQGRTVITICNYNRYQAPQNGQRDKTETPRETQPRHNRDTTETIQKEGKKEEGIKEQIPTESVCVRLNDFERFWKAYPDRKGNPKKPAVDAWRAAVRRGVDPEVMIRGAEGYARHCREQASADPSWRESLIAHARTWLSQARWEEYAEAPAPRMRKASEEEARAYLESVGRKNVLSDRVLPDWARMVPEGWS